jgi:hypothetical protein|tara:strand:+ start:73443 stop:73928 length:486 start_codon:yes stop_codon:yes gene_type:complete
MKAPSIININITIAAIGVGGIAEFNRSYTMQEHFDEVYLKDGEAYALEKFNLRADKVVVQDWPVIDEVLKTEISNYVGIQDKDLGNMAIPKVHNPMHSCFKAYRQFEVARVMIFVKPVSAGIVYAIQNDNWINELKNVRHIPFRSDAKQRSNLRTCRSIME